MNRECSNIGYTLWFVWAQTDCTCGGLLVMWLYTGGLHESIMNAII